MPTLSVAVELAFAASVAVKVNEALVAPQVAVTVAVIFPAPSFAILESVTPFDAAEEVTITLPAPPSSATVAIATPVVVVPLTTETEAAVIVGAAFAATPVPLTATFAVVAPDEAFVIFPLETTVAVGVKIT